MKRILEWLFTPSAAMSNLGERLGAVDAEIVWMNFTRAEVERPHGHIEEIPGVGRRRWNSASMAWEILDGGDRIIGVVCPDHLLREGDPAYEAMLDLIRDHIRT